MKKLICILSLSISLFACSSDEDKFIGKWVKEKKTSHLSIQTRQDGDHIIDKATTSYDTLEIKKENGVFIIDNQPFKYNKEIKALQVDLGWIKPTARINEKNELIFVSTKTFIFKRILN